MSAGARSDTIERMLAEPYREYWDYTLAEREAIVRAMKPHGDLLTVSRRWAELWYHEIERPDFWTDDFYRLAEGYANPTAITR